MIQGFDQGGQRAIGTITLDLDIEGFLSQVVCHVIAAPTSSNRLLGRPWLHRYNGIHLAPVFQILGIRRREAGSSRYQAIRCH